MEGRDLGGLLTDSCCEEFITIQGMKLKGTGRAAPEDPAVYQPQEHCLPGEHQRQSEKEERPSPRDYRSSIRRRTSARSSRA